MPKERPQPFLRAELTPVREHGKMAKTPLADFFNSPKLCAEKKDSKRVTSDLGTSDRTNTIFRMSAFQLKNRPDERSGRQSRHGMNAKRNDTGDASKIGILVEQFHLIRKTHGSNEAVNRLPHRDSLPPASPVNVRTLLKDRQRIHPEDRIGKENTSSSRINGIITNAL
jgi:hypothetical protein